MALTDIGLTRRSLMCLTLTGKEQEAIALILPHIKADLSSEELSRVRKVVDLLRIDIRSRYDKVHRKLNLMESRFPDWLDGSVRVPKDLLRHISSTPRASVPFSAKGTRAQFKEVAKIADDQTEDAIPLLRATSLTMKRRGERDVAAILSEAVKSPSRPAKIRAMISSPPVEVEDFSPEEALEVLLDLSLTLEQYNKLRNAVRKKKGHHNLFPPYHAVQNAKADCRPPMNVLDVTDTEAAVPLQKLLDHTAQRIAKFQDDVLVQEFDKLKTNWLRATLIASWGFDGSSSQSNYKQRPSAQHHGSTIDESTMFATTLVPLRLVGELGQIYWQNPAPQSVDFCRPVRLQYIKETPHVVIATRDAMVEDISKLSLCEVVLKEGFKISVRFEMRLTLIDGKILNILTGTSSMQVCALCKATPIQFNVLEDFKTCHVPHENLLYGASPLHSWIRLFECCLHLSQRLDIKKWQAKTAAQKSSVAAKKMDIQTKMWDQLGLIVDKPKSGGSGTSNDGNTARRAFQNGVIFSSILGLNENLIHRFYIILTTMASQHEINAQAFGTYCWDTAELFVSLYPWFYMPASVHKILIHGELIVRHSILPIGMLGEDAAESRNKFYRRFRERHARQCSRKANLEDVFTRSLDTSDPFLSSRRHNARPAKKRLPFPADVLLLLAPFQEPPRDENRPNVSRILEFDDDDDDNDRDEIVSEQEEMLISEDPNEYQSLQALGCSLSPS